VLLLVTAATCGDIHCHTTKLVLATPCQTRWGGFVICHGIITRDRCITLRPTLMTMPRSTGTCWHARLWCNHLARSLMKLTVTHDSSWHQCRDV
jgi:hypothetical protein